MKILLAAGLYPPDVRGPAIFAGQLVEYLQSHGVEVAVVPYREVRHLPGPLKFPFYFFKLLARGRSASAVVALHSSSVSFLAYVASKFLGAPLILRVGGDYAWEQGQQRYGLTDTLDEFAQKDKSEYPRAARRLYALQCFVARRAHAVVAPSHYLASIVRTWGVAPARIKVIYSASVHASLLSKDEARRTLMIGNEPFIFSLGALVPWKGFEALINAVALLRQDISHVKLVVAGEGGLHKELARRAAEAGMEEVFLGDIPNERVLIYLRAADLFVLNTNYEGLSHVLIEAMQSGLPIVTTPVGGNTELIDDGVNGRLVPFNTVEMIARAMRELLENRKLAVALGEAAKEKAERLFAAPHSMEQWEILLKQL